MSCSRDGGRDYSYQSTAPCLAADILLQQGLCGSMAIPMKRKCSVVWACVCKSTHHVPIGQSTGIEAFADYFPKEFPGIPSGPELAIAWNALKPIEAHETMNSEWAS